MGLRVVMLTRFLKIFLISTTLWTSATHASLVLQYSFFYDADSDDADTFTYGQMRNMIFLGPMLGKKSGIAFGQSVLIWSRTWSGGSETQDYALSLTEMGPRIIFWLGKSSNFTISAAYHVYAKGTYDQAGTELEVDGSSYLATIGYGFKMGNSARLSFSYNYHAVSVAQTIDTSDTREEVTYAFTNQYPSIDLTFAF